MASFFGSGILFDGACAGRLQSTSNLRRVDFRGWHSPMTTEKPEVPPSIAALRAGDREEWNRAYRPLRAAAMGVLMARLGESRGFDIENIASRLLTEEVVPQMANPRSDSFRKVATFEDLLRMTQCVAAQRSKDAERSRGREPEKVSVEDVQDWLQGAGREDGSGMEYFHWLTSHLDPPVPEMITQRFVEGMTVEEIADHHGKGVGVVCSAFYRAFKKLRTLLADAAVAKPQSK